MPDSDFFNLSEAKTELGIRDTDKADDNRLKSLGDQANRVLQNDLAPYVNSVPLTTSTTPAISNDMKNAVKWLVCAFYRSKIPEQSNHYRSLYEMVRDSIITALKTSPTQNTRTKWVVKATSYRSSKLAASE